jgi:Holliday junction resolvase
MQRYGKGARGERELIGIFSEHGFSVIRAAGSGVSSTSPPDILLFKRGKQFALECKAWNGGRVAIEHDKYDALKRWEDNSGITTMIAWKVPYRGWYLAYLSELERNPASYSITRSRIELIDRRLEDILGKD